VSLNLCPRWWTQRDSRHGRRFLQWSTAIPKGTLGARQKPLPCCGILSTKSVVPPHHIRTYLPFVHLILIVVSAANPDILDCGSPRPSTILQIGKP